ncbi:MAG: Asp-tRNA(Asn)/Glu-tRNA(Gln) amidotransferase subunit GatA [Candidatus Levyibacteriota bacterium]|nr:MAG: Asp-tRNA(Asn)/Glu-tRNA(Gln) amidotransferase subunit GatA [Candidatus Levybacteria bacterium]
MNLNQLTISEAKEGLKEKKFSSVELTKACLLQIEKHNKELNAFLTICKDKALAAAKKADEKLKNGDTSPLLGIPFSMKDVYSTKNVRTTAGSKVLDNYIPPYNATVYQKLVNAGAILLGKTNCDAWGHGGSTENSDFGVTKNPWNKDYVAGGSSGGSTAALASDMTIFEIGEDTGGSIRLPASFCSTVGLKVTYGRVSRYGAIAYASSLDTMGPITKSVEDAAYLLEIIAGGDEKDATSSPRNVPLYTKHLTNNIRGLRIGLPKEFFGKGLDIEVKQTIDEAIKTLTSQGAEIVDASIPSVEYGIATYYIIAPSETSSNLARYDGIRYGNKRSSFGDEAKRRIMIGTYALSAGYYDAYYKKAMQVRTMIKNDFTKAFEKCDVILSPVSPTPPFKIGEKTDDPLQMYLVDIYTVLINLAGVPSLALPCGFSKNNLPIGMQLIGPQFSEDKILNAGYQFEQATKWHKQKPNL